MGIRRQTVDCCDWRSHIFDKRPQHECCRNFRLIGPRQFWAFGDMQFDVDGVMSAAYDCQQGGMIVLMRCTPSIESLYLIYEQENSSCKRNVATK
jgi:hypothetical protein